MGNFKALFLSHACHVTLCIHIVLGCTSVFTKGDKRENDPLYLELVPL